MIFTHSDYKTVNVSTFSVRYAECSECGHRETVKNSAPMGPSGLPDECPECGVDWKEKRDECPRCEQELP